ncbi:helix-turn-helix domain-containing protein [Kroppenstedtia eburnea]|uniref:Anaphase-promoting complex subunit 5 n=1 Tax=Kroppenstedtia eburnea TaxID=714067 RepID=A0A1N7NE29_9BACL|nr:helix-turn-helix transcriptional regulator [Kroppenstedtia eburnea]QKI83045.1 tetratricopeptide repeat protein [Kroppenstedtia eburnea]SIS96663.1 Anaphase-promoting complex subunit 5 [Kroppenstedtia eburnea]
MNTLEVHDLGEIIRKVRKERGLRLEDLADENISPATISNVERGVPHVGHEKALYLINKLGIELSQVPELLHGQQLELKQLQKSLFQMECLCDSGDPRQALKKLDKLELENSHPYADYYYYIKGKSHSRLKNWSRAERALFNAVRLGSQTDTNIEASAFAELSLVSYYQNDLETALKYANSGIDAFTDNGSRSHTIHVLKRNKAIYLERLGRLGEALGVVHEVWDSLEKMEQVETKLTFYWLRAELSRRTGVYNEAIKYAEEGLELARFNYQHLSMFDLWIVLAGVYMELKEWDQAENYYSMALSLEGKLSEEDKKKFIDTYANLGLLYMKQNKMELAYKALNEAIRLGKKNNDAPHLSYALQAMGNFQRVQNNVQEAITYYQEGLEIARKHQLKKREYEILLYLAQCFENVDEQEFGKLTRNMYKIQLEIKNDGR